MSVVTSTPDGAGARDHEVGARRPRRRARARAAARTPYSAARRLAWPGRAVDDDDVGGTAAGQRGGGEGGHRAGARRRRPPGGRGPRRIRSSAADTRVGAAWSMPVSACARLPTRRACWNSTLSGRADRAGLLPAGQRIAGLAEDLRLADRHRVEPGGHLEQVGDRPVVVVDVEVRQQVLGGPARPLDQQPGQLLDAAVEAVDVGVDLEPVAGRDHRGLGDVLAGGDVAEQLGRSLGVDGHPLEQRDRSGAVGDAHDEDAHAVAPCASGGLRCSW